MSPTNTNLNELQTHFQDILSSTVEQLDNQFCPGYSLKNPKVLAAALELKTIMFKASLTSVANNEHSS